MNALLVVLLVLCFGTLALATPSPKGGVPCFRKMLVPYSQAAPRNSEGSLVQLKSGDYLLAWSEFTGGAGDADAAHIEGLVIEAAGEPVRSPYTLVTPPEGATAMSASLLRLQDGRLALLYLEKHGLDDCRGEVVFSADEGETWSRPVHCTPGEGYFVIANDRLMQLESGRLLVPASWITGPGGEPYKIRIFYSDDAGATWHEAEAGFTCPKRGAMEPGLLRLPDGRLWLYFRTQLGVAWQSFSKDDGLTWSQPEPSTLPSTEAPQLVRRVPGSTDLLAVVNPHPKLDYDHSGLRRPLQLLVSHDSSKTWHKVGDLEFARPFTYSYPSLLFADGKAFFTYYVADGRGLSLKSAIVPLSTLRRLGVDLPARTSEHLPLLSSSRKVLAQADETVKRNSEAGLVQFDSGELLLVWSEFTSGSGDNDSAHIAARLLSTKGEFAGPEYPLHTPKRCQNAMSVSLLRLQDNRLALLYIEKVGPDDWRPVLRFSEDEGKTWTESRDLLPVTRRFVVNNDRFVQLSSHRLLLPTAFPGSDGPWRSSVWYSDDLGRTWHESNVLRVPASPAGAQEPGVVELASGLLLLWVRTDTGYFWQAYSSDGGATWSHLEPSQVEATLSPQSIKRIPETGDLLLVYNPFHHELLPMAGRRTPLRIALSQDEGRTWQPVGDLEQDAEGFFCYPALCFVPDAVVCVYSDGWDKLVFKKITLAELYHRLQ